MAEHSESTPFLSHSDHHEIHDDPESEYSKPLPANSHFVKPLRILTAIVALLSLGIGGLLIACCVIVKVGPFQYTWGAGEAARDLAIVAFVNFVLSTPTIFFSAPILINIAVHIAMSVVMFVFSAQIFDNNGWPDDGFCRRWTNPTYPNRPTPLPERWECIQARRTLQIMMGVGGGVGIFIGLLILVLLALRIVALFRTKFWEGRRRPNFPDLSGWNPTGFTIQFTLSVLPHDKATPAPASGPVVAVTTSTVANSGPSSSPEESRLIETE